MKFGKILMQTQVLRILMRKLMLEASAWLVLRIIPKNDKRLKNDSIHAPTFWVGRGWVSLVIRNCDQIKFHWSCCEAPSWGDTSDENDFVIMKEEVFRHVDPRNNHPDWIEKPELAARRNFSKTLVEKIIHGCWYKSQCTAIKLLKQTCICCNKN